MQRRPTPVESRRTATRIPSSGDFGREDLGQEREVALLGTLSDLSEPGGVGANHRES
jgi:hypothetical protein